MENFIGAKKQFLFNKSICNFEQGICFTVCLDIKKVFDFMPRSYIERIIALALIHNNLKYSSQTIRTLKKNIH